MNLNYLKNPLRIRYGTSEVLASELNGFTIPGLIEVATQLKLDISLIKAQLAQAELRRDKDQGWIERAGRSLTMKRSFLHVVEQCITQKKQIECDRIKDTAEHFRAVAKEILPPALFVQIDKKATERHSQSINGQYGQTGQTAIKWNGSFKKPKK
jgi:hypothetical protein